MEKRKDEMFLFASKIKIEDMQLKQIRVKHMEWQLNLFLMKIHLRNWHEEL